jgi:hypothetical protein
MGAEPPIEKKIGFQARDLHVVFLPFYYFDMSVCPFPFVFQVPQLYSAA